MKIVLLSFCLLFIGTSTGFDYSLQQLYPVNGLRFQRKNSDFCVDGVPKSDNDKSISNKVSVKTTTLTAEIFYKSIIDKKNISNIDKKIIFIIILENEKYYIKLVNSTTVNSNSDSSGNDSDSSDKDSDDSNDKDSDDSSDKDSDDSSDKDSDDSSDKDSNDSNDKDSHDRSDKDSDESSDSDEDDTHNSSDEESLCGSKNLGEESVITTHEVELEPAKSSSNAYTVVGQVIGVKCSAGISYYIYINLINIKTKYTFSITGHSGYGSGKEYSNLRLKCRVNNS